MASTLPLLVVTGPTASGKSGFALALATRLPVEIVTVDSAQVYRGMDIGTAKPDADERAEVPHHLIDIVDPSEVYSAARFAADAAPLIDDIRGRGRLPLLVGGTMLYLRALLDGLSELPPADPALRRSLSEEAATLGVPALHARLAAVDPETSARLHPNDWQRIQRALEIHATTGRPASAAYRAPPAVPRLGPVLRFVLEGPERAVLHRRIADRFHRMMREGLLEEVRALHRRGDLHPQLPSIRSVGYRQLWRHLDGELNLDDAVEAGVAATRQLAKRQLTWLRSQPGGRRLPENHDRAVACVIEDVGRLASERPPRQA